MIKREELLPSYTVRNFNLMQMTGFSKTPGKLENRVEAEIKRLVKRMNS